MPLTVRAKIWYIGIAVMTMSLWSFVMYGLNQWVIIWLWAMMLRWESCAPFAMPVVPPVYCNTAKSSGSIDGLDNVSKAPFLRADLKLTALGMWNEGTSFLMYFTTT